MENRKDDFDAARAAGPVDGAGDTPEQPPRAEEVEVQTDTTAEAAEAAGDRTDDAPAAEQADEAARLREALLRMQADMDNRRKRLEREMEQVRKFANEQLLRDLVPVLDSMDQALLSGEAGVSEGMALTHKLLLDVLKRHGLEVIDPVGERFDPSWHEAMAMQPSSEQPADHVLQVLQKGYRLNGRLVRPARVIVATAAE